ncbi:MAG: outer membrane protein assembly factor BamA, partial [Kiritimatiellae bacterium]|nr:outer membrane protein assembly factor BamA [Kiritimatiellia bacterium]
ADYLGNKKVRELLELGVGDLVDDATLAVRSQKVAETYRKKLYPYVKITWTIDVDPETGQADVAVTVREGRRARARQVLFEGNRSVKARKLRSVMKQRGAHLFSWLTGAGTYDPDALAVDLGALRGLYLDLGHLDATIGEPVIREVDRKRIDIVIPVTEGPRYHIGRVSLKGVELFPPEDVRRQVGLRAGDVAALKDIRKAAQAVRDYYGSRGYIRTVAKYDLEADPETGVVDLPFSVTEGQLAYIRDIRIRGNTRTKDKVIRRELAVYPGEVFNEVRVRTSEKRLWNLGYFSYVNSIAEDTPEADRYDLTLEVEEQKTGQFVVGAGFSSVDDLIGFVELSQGNFDLFGWPHFTGGGQKLKFRSQFGTERTDFEFSFVEPWLFDRRLSLGFDLFQHDRRFLSDDYDQKNTGGSLSLSKGLGRFYRTSLQYSLEEIDVYDLADEASFLIREEEGTRMKSAMALSLVRDTRDSVFIPTRGNRTTLSASLAGGPLGAETDLYLLEARSSQFFPLWFGHVFNLKGWTAVVEEFGDTDRVPIFDRLFLGGARTLRGFRYRDVGPKVATSKYSAAAEEEEAAAPAADPAAATTGTADDDEPVGGQTAAYATAEYTVPLGQKLRLATFYDVGMVWEDPYEWSGDFNSSWGVGLRIDMPGFPLRLDYAWPIEADDYNDQPSGRFSFLIGYVF